jgi:hypothetical protein
VSDASIRPWPSRRTASWSWSVAFLREVDFWVVDAISATPTVQSVRFSMTVGANELSTVTEYGKQNSQTVTTPPVMVKVG